MTNLTLTDSDQKLIACLREDARRSISDLARTLKLSRTTVQARLTRLEQLGVIKGYTLVLGEDYRDQQLRAQILIVHAARQAAGIVTALKRMPAVQGIHTVSGSYDLLIDIEAQSATALDGLLDEIGAIDGVERTTTLIKLATKLKR